MRKLNAGVNKQRIIVNKRYEKVDPDSINNVLYCFQKKYIHSFVPDKMQ